MNDFEKMQSCITQITHQEPRLSGAGAVIAVLDSGIDYFLPEFRGADGLTRIIAIWDQTAQPDETLGLAAPEGYRVGVLYTREMINRALALGRTEGRRLVPVIDLSGHGTAVAGVAADVATGAELLVVKLGNPAPGSFPRTTQLMRGINYAVNVGVALNKPVAVNISFGNTYGDHQGNSLLERFVDNAAETGRSSVIIGSGNEGATSGHTAGVIGSEERTVELAVDDYETGLSIQLWKFYQDIYDITIISPGGERMKIELSRAGMARTVRGTLEGTQLLCYLGKPIPYNVRQEIFIDMIPSGNYISSGVWRIVLEPVLLVTGEYMLYLPSYAMRSNATGFFLPTPDMTLTVPSTARRAVTVGAYDARHRSSADFSGRGYVYRYDDGRSDTAGGRRIIAEVKPDLCAPGVDITVPVPDGGYTQVSGTSFAAPFVTGTAALLMEWGIVMGNDRFLYGERLKAALIRGAGTLAGALARPDSRTGWGTLCAGGALEAAN